ncbi:DNA-binding transcriptional regulator, LysR family [Pseudarcicella hirudinis]|uniref:DNA-binding transcriptional regulator, LysR family n=1 Tax=Pseudarcicella hirudinis TaxID=1079859 RepID=A0A1I5TSX6_9BACT|nr:LysR substrate-binding domain-containing protein [Pseudarcicella hirudinis]SFP86165.1 DNA-binding transcriptional regulator, LysR family [Pseudarcicella hirudinis]
MELRQLKYFLVLAEELHFGKAAEKLFIVQPALTRQIQLLEEELGISLFKRNKRSVQLTVSGEYFSHEVKGIIEQLEMVKNRTRLVEDGEKGEVRIGYVGSCIHTFLPDILSGLHEKYPHIQTYLNEMTSSSQILGIQNGELDIAFLRNPAPNHHFGQQMVFSETFSLVVPDNHFITGSNFEGIHQLANEDFILPTRMDGEIYYQLQLSICENAGFSPKIAHETVHGHTVLKLIDHQLGITFLPTSFRSVTNANVRFIELKNIPQRAEITALWDKKNPNPSLHRFLGLIQNTF